MSLKPVFVASSEIEAEIVKSLLINAGIEAFVSADDGGGTLSALAASEGVEVLVDEDAEAEALSVLDKYRAGDTAISEDQGE